MKYIMVTVIATWLAILPANAGENIPLKVSGNLLLLADWNMTRQIAGHPELYREHNPILGEHPSRRRVDAYFAGVIIGANVADHYMGPKASNIMWGVINVVQIGAVGNNYSIGLRIEF